MTSADDDLGQDLDLGRAGASWGGGAAPNVPFAPPADDPVATPDPWATDLEDQAPVIDLAQVGVPPPPAPPPPSTLPPPPASAPPGVPVAPPRAPDPPLGVLPPTVVPLPRQAARPHRTRGGATVLRLLVAFAAFVLLFGSPVRTFVTDLLSDRPGRGGGSSPDVVRPTSTNTPITSVSVGAAGEAAIGDAARTATGEAVVSIRGPGGVQFTVLRYVEGQFEQQGMSDPIPAGATGLADDDGLVLATGLNRALVKVPGGVGLVTDASYIPWTEPVEGGVVQAAITSAAVVVRTDRGVLTGLALDTGMPLWSQPVPAEAELFDVSSAILLSQLRDDGRTVLRTIDPLSGAPSAPLTVPCSLVPSGFEHGGLVASSGTQVLGFVVDDEGAGCTFGFDVASPFPSWERPIEGIDPASTETPVAGRHDLALRDQEGQVVAISTDDGLVRHVGFDDGRRRVPLGFNDGALIVGAGGADGKPDQAEVWDRGGQNRRWYRPLPAGIDLANPVLHPDADPAEAGGVSWTASDVLLFGPAGGADGGTAMERFPWFSDDQVDPTLDLDLPQPIGTFDLAHPKDEMIMGFGDSVTFLVPDAPIAVQEFRL